MKQFLFKQWNKLPLLIFLLFLFFLPQQFGPHFWPNFSYVQGIRIDYLSPTIYISDILLLALLISSGKQVFSSNQVKSFLSSKLFIIFLIILCTPLLYAQSVPNLFYGLFLFFKFLYVGLFAAVVIKKQDLRLIALVFLLGGFLQSLLAVSQFLHQGSLGGILYFFGERTIFLSSIGAAVISTGQGLLLRPYGTFSHPNVLAFYLLVSFFLGLYMLKTIQGLTLKTITIFILTIIQFGIILSFSRSVYVAEILILFMGLRYGNVKNFRNHKQIGALIFLVLSIFLVFFSNRVSNFTDLSSAISPRLALLQINFEILKEHLLFGVGLNNHLFSQVEFQKNFSQVYLQPVHNIYLLTAVQVGIIGLSIVLYFLYKTVRVVWISVRDEKNKFSISYYLLPIFYSLLFVGLFDHYFLTIQQGQLLTALILGLSWNSNLQAKK